MTRVALGLTPVLATILVVLSTLTNAQTAGTGAISGTVTDPSGAVVTAAKVSVTNEATGATVSVLSTNTGRYLVPLLSPGSYRIEVTKESFKVSTYPKIVVAVTWRVPEDISGAGQARGNSGVFLAAPGPDSGYELQVLDSYENSTYVNGQAGSIYKQGIPLVNPIRKPGEWQTYDVVWTAPTFQGDGSLRTPAYVTVFFNGVLVQNHFELKGETRYIGQPSYRKYESAPIRLQAHGDPSKPISFRNIWLRELQ
jgi:3-keto-disaccharide hydrolase/Carboxypeptidase regulatory-like domain